MDITTALLRAPNKFRWIQIKERPEIQQKVIKLNRVLVNYIEDVEAVEYEKWREIILAIPYAMNEIPRCFNQRSVPQAEIHTNFVEILKDAPLFWIHICKIYREVSNQYFAFDFQYLKQFVKLEFGPLLPYPGPLNKFCITFGNPQKSWKSKRKRDPPFDDIKEYTLSLLRAMNSELNRKSACIELCKMIYRIHPLMFYGFPKEIRQSLKTINMDPLFEKQSKLVTSSLIFWLSAKKLDKTPAGDIFELMMSASWPIEVPLNPSDFIEVIHFLPYHRANAIIKKYNQLNDLEKLKLRRQWRKKSTRNFFNFSNAFSDCEITTIN